MRIETLCSLCARYERAEAGLHSANEDKERYIAAKWESDSPAMLDTNKGIIHYRGKMNEIQEEISSVANIDFGTK